LLVPLLGGEDELLGAAELLGVLLEEEAPGLLVLDELEGGVERVAEGELVPDELFWLDPELSQATSDNADSSAAAISHFLSIRSSPFGFGFAVREAFLVVPTPLITGANRKNSPSQFSHSRSARIDRPLSHRDMRRTGLKCSAKARAMSGGATCNREPNATRRSPPRRWSPAGWRGRCRKR
jgi:hypothetical protein